MADEVDRIVGRLTDRQRRTLLGIGGVGERITVRTDDAQAFEELGLVRGGGTLELTELGRHVADRIRGG